MLPSNAEAPSLTEAKRALVNGGPVDLSDMLLLSDYPRFHAQRTPDKIALICGDHRWSYAALDHACDQAAGLLVSLGLRPGGRFAYIGKNNDLFFAVLIGAIRAQLVLVPVNWRNTAAETRYVLEDSGAEVVFADAEFGDMAREASGNRLPLIIIDEPGAEGLRAKINAAAPAPRATLDPATPGLQFYTSGTTGRPKGVITSQRAYAIQRHIEMISPYFFDWGDEEVLLSPLPNFHIGGMSWVGTGLVRGATIVVTPDTAPAILLDLCLEHGVTRTFIVPMLVRGLINEMDARGVRVPSLRGIHYGAASMDPALLERSVDRFGCQFLQYYGMTEISGTMTILGPREHDASRPHLLRSVGRVLPGHQIAIRDSQGHLLKIDQPGEIWVKGPTLLIEYWNKPEATAEALIDGWYRTGDGGRFDAEGYLYLTDRIKDMIVSGGENVYPAEVEAVLRDHPAIADCTVFGLPHAKWGEGVTVALELKPGQTIDPDEVIAFARRSLAAYKVPRRIEVVDLLPRTASGKVQRALIRKQFLES